MVILKHTFTVKPSWEYIKCHFKLWGEMMYYSINDIRKTGQTLIKNK